MIAFWGGAALLMLVALAFILPPLLRKRTAVRGADREALLARVYRDEIAELKHELVEGRLDGVAYEAGVREIEKRLLEDAPALPGERRVPETDGVRSAPSVALGLAVTVPLAAIVLYLGLGSPDAVNPSGRFGTAQDSHNITREQIETLVGRLAERLKRNPDDAEGWVMLARTYTVLERFDEASRAYASAAKLIPDDAGLLADYADTLAVTRGRKLAGEPYDIIKRALKIDPRHVKSLALAGSAEFERGNYAGAVEFWQRGLAPLPPESDFAQSLRASLDEARSRLRLEPKARAGASAAKSTRDPVQDAGSGALTGIVKLAPELAGRAAPEDTVYVFARADGVRPPVAILKVKVRELPYRYRLDDSSAMSPDALLSKQARVLVGARVAKAGTVMAQSGDLQGESARVAPGAANVDITIDRVVP